MCIEFFVVSLSSLVITNVNSIATKSAKDEKLLTIVKITFEWYGTLL